MAKLTDEVGRLRRLSAFLPLDNDLKAGAEALLAHWCEQV